MIEGPRSELDASVVPDVFIENLVVFERPDVRIEDLVRFDTPPARRKGQFREWIESLVFTVIFVLVFTSYIAQATQVPTESMKPTILVGDHFFLDKLAFPANYPEAIRSFLPRRSIERGDIVAFKSPTDGNIPFVKRIVGLPGDTVELRNKELYIDDQLMDEPYKIHVDSTTYSADSWTPEELKIRDNYGPVTVPPDSYFVMGDNRDNSNDSRYWGFINRDEIIGRPLFVYWSYESDPYIAGEKTWREWIEGYILIGMHFFDRTRWFRMGTMIE
jgi:signal peptidase I